MSTALQKISREAKRIRKKHPGRSWNKAIKEASKKYNAGTIGKTRKRSKPKRKATKRKASRKRASPRKKSPARKRASPRRRVAKRKPAVRYKVIHKVRRVRGTGGLKTRDVLLFGGIAIAAYLLLKPKGGTTYTPVQGAPPLTLTNNPQRDNKAQEIIAWAAAGGMAIDAITKLIQTLNTKSEAQVDQIHTSIATGDGVPGWALA